VLTLHPAFLPYPVPPTHACRPYLQLYEQVQAEADVGFALRNKIVPDAVNWFTGEAEDDEDDDEDDEGARQRRGARRVGSGAAVFGGAPQTYSI
jgi:hypothetical protein